MTKEEIVNEINKLNALLEEYKRLHTETRELFERNSASQTRIGAQITTITNDLPKYEGFLAFHNSIHSIEASLLLTQANFERNTKIELDRISSLILRIENQIQELTLKINKEVALEYNTPIANRTHEGSDGNSARPPEERLGGFSGGF